MDGKKKPETQNPSPLRGADKANPADFKRPADYDAPEYYSRDQKPAIGTPQSRRDADD